MAETDSYIHSKVYVLLNVMSRHVMSCHALLINFNCWEMADRFFHYVLKHPLNSDQNGQMHWTR